MVVVVPGLPFALPGLVISVGGGAPISPVPSWLLFKSEAVHTRSGVVWSVLIVNATESPGLIGIEEKNAIVVGDVFFPIQPFCKVNDLKFPFFI